jgi:hypothetical protein
MSSQALYCTENAAPDPEPIGEKLGVSADHPEKRECFEPEGDRGGGEESAEASPQGRVQNETEGEAQSRVSKKSFA